MPKSGCVWLVVACLGSAVPAAAQDGAALYSRHCVSCHEGNAVARAPARDVISALTPERIVASLESGTMRVQGEALTPDERRAIANFLSTARPPAAPPTVRRCEPSPSTAAIRPTTSDWAAWGVSFSNDRYQSEPAIAPNQVANLKVRWAFGFEGENAAAANPTIVGDRLFVGSASGRVFALGLKDGCQHWMFTADGGVRGALTVGEGRDGSVSAYFGDLRATVYSVDVATGKLRWKTTVDDHRVARITGSPVLFNGNGLLYVPISSTEEATGAQAGYQCCTFRGSVVALNALTGERVWQTYMVGSHDRSSVEGVIRGDR
jgi:polyvinyl alcohol dehydrogenase (cytochrome)